MKSPLTNSLDTKRLASLSAQNIAEQWQSALGVDVGERFRSLPAIDYWQCNITGLRWYSPPEAAGDGLLYGQLEKFGWYYMPKKWEFQVALNLLNAQDRILEVGVGKGYFLEAARAKRHEVEGVELNLTAAEAAEKRGFLVHKIRFEELIAQGIKPYDVICGFQVLEHVVNPRQFLEGMLGVLKPGGRLILSVPNEAVMTKIDKGHSDLWNQPPHHMSHWDAEVFQALEQILPVKVRSVHREKIASYHVSWIVTGYLRGLLAPLGGDMSRLLVSRYTTFPFRLLMLAGLRKLFAGHTLLVELQYLPG